ncbi:MAG: response regulator [Proteobacteria bacterium]|nr:response regulator [Pseudomonadota bacterium]
MIRQMPGIYWIVDLDLRILHTGGAIEEILGYPQDRHIGKTMAEVHLEEGGDHDPTDAHRAALAGVTVPFTNRYRGRMLSSTIAPLRQGDVIIGAIGTSLDVTAWRTLEQRMVDAQRAESLGVLAGGLAHDFNNLLVTILGNADLALREMPPGAAGRCSLQNIRDAALRAAELTDQLLAYAGRGSLSLTRLAPAPIIDELLRISAPSMPTSTKVVVDLPRDLVLRSDPSQFRQIMLNLINNARDALGQRGGTIAIAGRIARLDGAIHEDDIVAAPAGTYVLLDVADDGPGIDGEQRRRVFEPFFTTKSTGHGLGLAAVVGIVRSHGGGLRLVSAPGEGCRFQVFLPSNVTPPPIAAVAVNPERTVLVIDDEDLVRDVVSRMIEDLGYATITAADGHAGLAVLARQRVDAVIVDLSMPRMSGVDLIAAIRVQQPTLPIVLCSGFARSESNVEADAYLPKPFRLEALEQTLARVLGADYQPLTRR